MGKPKGNHDMVDNKKVSSKEKEQKLIEKIEKAKKDLLSLKEKRKNEIGTLAYRHGLDVLDNLAIDKAFAQIARELSHEDV